MRVIEPGCGTGRLTELLAQRVGPTGLVVAFNISSAMTAACAQRVKRLPQADVYCASAEEFPFPSQAFDLAICHQVFPHFDDKRRAVANLAAALKPTGRFVIFHFIGSDAINDFHRKADPSVLHDMMPSEGVVRELLGSVGLEVLSFSDDEDGYMLTASFAETSRLRYQAR
ncbi:MAG: class I SAM-dependent methyltransferase [Desulfomonile sp.]|nr:class I SAM-dependent methyltransferase [Desulfomonile sp.]